MHRKRPTIDRAEPVSLRDGGNPAASQVANSLKPVLSEAEWMLYGFTLGADSGPGGPFGNGLSGMLFVFWKEVINHLPACFCRTWI